MHQCPLSNTLFVFLGDRVTGVVVKNRYNTDIFMPFLSPDELDHIQPTLTDQQSVAYKSPSLNDHGCKISKSLPNRSNTQNVSLGTEYKQSFFLKKKIRPLNFVPVQMPDYEALNHSLIRCHVVFYPHFNHVIGETTILNVPYITQSATEDDKMEPSQARDTDFLSRR